VAHPFAVKVKGPEEEAGAFDDAGSESSVDQSSG
jgi:hypothetical protein